METKMRTRGKGKRKGEGKWSKKKKKNIGHWNRKWKRVGRLGGGHQVRRYLMLPEESNRLKGEGGIRRTKRKSGGESIYGKSSRSSLQATNPTKKVSGLGEKGESYKRGNKTRNFF